ncbi:hypothetical protein O3M35_004049 [Rhynocoris fuscipes]|uniref:Actin maturation protease n=1 Tax=Rhynocoris fuscipes TaxID=488301 RepID=A0AAW1CPI8_9HEMI
MEKGVEIRMPISPFGICVQTYQRHITAYTKEDALRTIQQRWNAIASKFMVAPSYFKYVHLTPSLQSGPTCGIVALAMISSVCPPSLTAEQLLTIAKSLGYTRCGEMFSAHNMLNLIQKNCYS